MTECIGPAALGLYGMAARLLGWRPADFWAATPAELITALSQPGQPAAFGRTELNRMMEQEND